MADNKVSLQVANKGNHGAFYLKWRMDELTQSMFFRRVDTTWEDFKSIWSNDYFNNDVPPPAIALDEKENPVGFVTFKPINLQDTDNKKCSDISIIVSPEHRGKGFGKAILSCVPGYLESSDLDAIVSVVKDENFASRSIFEKSGYKFLSDGVISGKEDDTKYKVKKYIYLL